MKTLLDYYAVERESPVENDSVRFSPIGKREGSSEIPLKTSAVPRTKMTQREWERLIPEDVLRDPDSVMENLDSRRYGIMVDLFRNGVK
ncbi:MAG: hypothetical protein ACP5MU_06255, partial [Thermoplasmata archaeon]